MTFYSRADLLEIATLLSLLNGSEELHTLVAHDLWVRYELTIAQAILKVDQAHRFLA